MTDVARLASMSTIGLGLGQALAPQATAKAFGLRELDGQGVWLARLLGCANVALGSLGLKDDLSEQLTPTLNAVLAGNAAVTVAGAASGGISKRTAGLVLGFIAALAAADAAAARQS